MKIIFNGKNDEIGGSVNVSEFLLKKNFSPERVVVEINKNIVKRAEWNKTFIKENDGIEILSFVGGG